ncbi:peptidase M15 [Mycolicibacterium rhodesiae]|uniref:Peptidase M15 n=1 Tax=Mycolicibacterium rhodesiae TaxID=36814 RepID=A0A1X0J5C8_MYCRH|nr:peptidase M15 [Mycolicibacterium rhodesiae]
MSVALAAAVLVQCSPAPDPIRAAPSSVTTTSTTAAPVVQPVTAADLGATWRPGCPVAPGELRRIDLDYIGLDGHDHRGVLVVHRDVVDEVIAIFADLRGQRYPIAKMQTPQHYPGAADELSMEDNNTSAFNCRALPGSTTWSLHAYGRAIDVNPQFNPYLGRNGDLEPATAGGYLDRHRTDPGMLHADDPAVRAFTDRGWVWGGNWRNPIDYQHFERR